MLTNIKSYCYWNFKSLDQLNKNNLNATKPGTKHRLIFQLILIIHDDACKSPLTDL